MTRTSSRHVVTLLDQRRVAETDNFGHIRGGPGNEVWCRQLKRINGVNKQYR